jgi:hypothetical protein
LTQNARYKGLGADFGEKHEPVSDIDTVSMGSLKALDPNRPIREADITALSGPGGPMPLSAPITMLVNDRQAKKA